MSRSICFLPCSLVHLAVRWGVPQWPFPQLLHPTFKFRLIRLERAAQSVTFHQVSPDTLQLGGIPQHWPFTLSWGNSPLLWLIWSKCYLIKLWDSDSEQMDISPIGWSHLGPLIVKNIKQPWPMGIGYMALWGFGAKSGSGWMYNRLFHNTFLRVDIARCQFFVLWPIQNDVRKWFLHTYIWLLPLNWSRTPPLLHCDSNGDIQPKFDLVFTLGSWGRCV